MDCYIPFCNVIGYFICSLMGLIATTYLAHFLYIPSFNAGWNAGFTSVLAANVGFIVYHSASSRLLVTRYKVMLPYLFIYIFVSWSDVIPTHMG